MILPPFQGPRLKVKRARKHIADLENMVAEFGGRVKIALVPIAETEHHLHYVLRFSEPPPEEVPLLIGDALHNTRAALDILICDLARIRGKSSSRLKFPFAPNADKLEEYLKKDFPRLGEDIVDAIRGLDPYTGGNFALRALHDLDIDDKHETVLPFYLVAMAQMQMPMPELFNDLFEQVLGVHPDRFGMPLNEGMSVQTLKGRNPWESIKAIPGPPQPTFPPDLPFGGRPVVEVLIALANMVEDIIEGFAGEFGQQGSPPAAL